jgi:streptomycin 6-kinase
VAALAAVAVEVAAEWGLGLGPPYATSRYSYVAPVGERAVLKIRLPDDDESLHEPQALELWSGDGAVRLLRHDPRRHALLLERATPGSDVAALEEDEASAVTLEVAQRLWRPASTPFRWIGDHVPQWLDGAERAGRPLVPLARTLYATLAVGRATLVHGDLHHHNVLAHGPRHVAIDPKPMLGEPEFDVAPFLWNPLGTRMRLDTAEARLRAFAAAGLDEGRMRAWAVIRGSYLRRDPRELAVLRALV